MARFNLEVDGEGFPGFILAFEVADEHMRQWSSLEVAERYLVPAYCSMRFKYLQRLDEHEAAQRRVVKP